MTAYYYVKSGGTATGDGGRYTTQKTGPWATAFTATSEYYSDLDTAIDSATTATAGGDFVLTSNASAYSSSTTSSITLAPSDQAGVNVICVDDGNCDQSAIATSALEHITGGTSDFNLNGGTYGRAMSAYGLWIKSDDNVSISTGTGTTTFAVNCSFEVTGASDVLYMTAGEGAHSYLENCTLRMGNSGAVVAISGGSWGKMIGGGVVGSPTSFILSAGTGAGSYEFIGVDLSSVVTNLVAVGAVSAVDAYQFTFKRCQLASGITFNSVTPRWGQRTEVYNSGNDASVEYQYYVAEGACTAEDETSIYRDGSTAFPEQNQKISIKCSTSASASQGRAFAFDCPTRYAELSSTSTDLMRIYILSSATLTDADVWAELIYPDGTNKHVPNRLLSVTDAFDPLRAGTTLDTNTEAWTGRTAENRYQIDLDTSGDPGADCVPIIRVYVAKASATIYFCTSVDLV